MDEPINNPAGTNINTLLQTPPEPPVPPSPISPPTPFTPPNPALSSTGEGGPMPPITPPPPPPPVEPPKEEPTPFTLPKPSESEGEIGQSPISPPIPPSSPIPPTPPLSPIPSDTFVLKPQLSPKKKSPQPPVNLKKVLPVAVLVLFLIAAGAGAVLIRERYQKPKAILTCNPPSGKTGNDGLGGCCGNFTGTYSDGSGVCTGDSGACRDSSNNPNPGQTWYAEVCDIPNGQCQSGTSCRDTTGGGTTPAPGLVSCTTDSQSVTVHNDTANSVTVTCHKFTCLGGNLDLCTSGTNTGGPLTVAAHSTAICGIFPRPCETTQADVVGCAAGNNAVVIKGGKCCDSSGKCITNGPAGNTACIDDTKCALATPTTGTPVSPTPTNKILNCKEACLPLPVGVRGVCKPGLNCIQVDPYHSECINSACNYNDQNTNCECPGVPTPTLPVCQNTCDEDECDRLQCATGSTCPSGFSPITDPPCTCPGGKPYCVRYDDQSCCPQTPTPTPTGHYHSPTPIKTPTPTLTPPPGFCGCSSIRLFRDGQEIQSSQLAAGEEIRVGVWGSGENQWKGRIKIYKGSGPNLLSPALCRTGNLISEWCETEQHAAGVGYFIDITVPAGEGTYTIEGEVSCEGNWK